MVTPNDGYNQFLSEKELFSKYKVISDNHPEYWGELKKEIRLLNSKCIFFPVKEVNASIKLIEMNQGISFLPLYITKNNYFNLLINKSEHIVPPVSYTYIYYRKKTKYLENFIDTFKSFIKKEQL